MTYRINARSSPEKEHTGFGGTKEWRSYPVPALPPLPAAGEMQLSTITSVQSHKNYLVTLTMNPKVPVHHLCVISGSSVGLCGTKPLLGPRTDSNTCYLNYPAVGSMFKINIRSLRAEFVTLYKDQGENEAQKAALDASSICCWKHWQDFVQMGSNLYTALSVGLRAAKRGD